MPIIVGMPSARRALGIGRTPQKRHFLFPSINCFFLLTASVSRQYYDGCMIDRNHRLVESADLLLAVFNGVRRSGTGATVNYTLP